MFLLPVLAAFGASLGWASGIVLAEKPAKQLGSFTFTHTQLVACSAILAVLCSALGYWPTIDFHQWPAFASSICIGIILGNLAMIECLRRGGPRRTELLLALKAPLVAVLAFVWLGEVPSSKGLLGAAITLAGVVLAILFGSNTQSKSEATKGSIFWIVLLGIVAAAAHGFGFLIMKPAMLAGTEPLAASAVRLLGAAFLMSLIALWPSAMFQSRNKITPQLLGRTILPGFIGYVISSTLLLYAFANLEAGIAATLGSLSPVLLLPILWLKEGVAPHPNAVLGAGFAVLGTGIMAFS